MVFGAFEPGTFRSERLPGYKPRGRVFEVIGMEGRGGGRPFRGRRAGIWVWPLNLYWDSF